MITPPSSADDGPDWLQHQWIVAGVIASAARFVPIPFVDDTIRTQCRRFVVSRTLAASGAALSTNELQPLYGDSGGFIAGTLGTIAKVPLKLMLFPIRKILSIATSIRGVPMEITHAVLLGRTLRRLLSSEDFDAKQAHAFRFAFDESFSRMDFHAVHAVISDALHGVSNWKSSAIESARALTLPRPDVDEELPATERTETTATRVQESLDHHKTAQLFAEFDQRFDVLFERRRNQMRHMVQ